MVNALLETVGFHMGPGKKPVYPDTIRGCTIRSTCLRHLGFAFGGPAAFGTPAETVCELKSWGLRFRIGDCGDRYAGEY
jgi:hypothetical protein